MNAVWNSYGQLCGCPEIFKKSCKFFCRELDIRVAEKVNGKIRFYDVQSGEKISSKIFSYVEDDKTLFWRIDDLEPSDRGITACEVGD